VTPIPYIQQLYVGYVEARYDGNNQFIVK
jgi:hypothetical protein